MSVFCVLFSDATHRFGLLRVRSPLLTEYLLVSTPPGTEMFYFPGYASSRNFSYQTVSLGVFVGEAGFAFECAHDCLTVTNFPCALTASQSAYTNRWDHQLRRTDLSDSLFLQNN